MIQPRPRAKAQASPFTARSSEAISMRRQRRPCIVAEKLRPQGRSSSHCCRRPLQTDGRVCMNENMEEIDEQRPSAPLCSWERADELIGVVCLVLIVVSIVWGVLTRYILERSASWSFELAVIAFGWMVFFGTAAGVRYRMHADI